MIESRQRYLPCEGTVCFSFLRKIHCHFFGFMVIYLLWLRSLLCINPSTVLREVLQQVDLSTQIGYILCAIILLMNIVVVSVIERAGGGSYSAMSAGEVLEAYYKNKSFLGVYGETEP